MVTIGLLVLRIVMGLTVAAHGAQKLFGVFDGPGLQNFAAMLESLGVKPGRYWAVVAAVAELAGGVLVAVGLFTPIASLVVASDLLVAILTIHLAKGFWSTKGGYEYPLTLVAGMLAISLVGPGRAAIDTLIGLRLPEPITWVITAIIVLLGALAAAYGRKVPALQARLGAS